MAQNKEPSKKGNKMAERDGKGRFLPGHRGNPDAKGRPRNELSITTKQREMLSLPCPYAPGKTWLEWLADRGMALAGENAAYYRELMDRLEGKITQPFEGQIESKVIWIVGKGYAGDKPDISTNQQTTE